MKITKITKKELKKVWDAVKNPPFGWGVHCIYIFEYKGKLETFVQYNGQGTLSVIYNNEVKNKSYTASELFSDFTNSKDAVENAKNLIESAWSK